jgi:hypothetical protein
MDPVIADGINYAVPDMVLEIVASVSILQILLQRLS